MKAISEKTLIENTFLRLRDFSFKEKKEPFLDEEHLNFFLDAINDLKISLSEKTDKIEQINIQLEKLTWLKDPDEECLMLINDLIASAKDLHSSLTRQFLMMGFFLKRNIAKIEILSFKSAVGDLQESYEDLESVYFFLPEMPGFVETTRKLSLI